MNSLFAPADREALLARLANLQPSSTRLWGKMNPAQMLTHCTRALETAAGVTPRKQAFLGKILTPFIRASVVGEKPFSRNSPTDPTFVVSDERDFETERKRLLEVIDLFVSRGPELAGKQTHSFFGKLNGEEWGVLSYKHIDHHLRQFGG
jgi:hypothetical protein